MIKPSLDQLSEKVDSKYTLVILGARRGRDIQAGKPKMVDSRSNKPVTIALEELVAGKIFFERAKQTTGYGRDY
ncbi:MAG TPA: DNA-directed RNA polymerase subunit omega [Symbiobacteriaceae bacterium]|jgi:DNA-directed RNA polymerase subunit omega|nr:DNA-directed RNA polymerase subunit omega [Symbiobacteriaceae bacterium]